MSEQEATAPIVEEPKVEEPKVEEPKVEEPKVEEVKSEESKTEEPKVEESKTEEPKAEEPKSEESKTEESKTTEKPKKKSNVVSDPSTLPKSSDHAEILKQVEFYFSDQNLPKDKYLSSLTKENDGWVPITTIACFGRMRRFSPFSAIVEALKKSPELLEVSEDGELVRRKIPLVSAADDEADDDEEAKEGEDGKPRKKPESKATQAFNRSIYAKGFGEETPTSQYDIEKFFESFAPVTQVRLRRTEDKKFKGSVFVEFAKLEDAKRFLEQDPKPMYNNTTLITMSKAAYVDMKSQEHGFNKNAKGGNNRRKGGFQNNRKRRFDGKRNNNRDDKKPRTEESSAPVAVDSK